MSKPESIVAVLFARHDSNYRAIPGVDVWDAERDARNWPGGGPCVAHPPCRAWGRLRQFAKPMPGEKEMAVWAVQAVRRWGGALEHPYGSSLWGYCNLPVPGDRDQWGGWTLPILQWWFGHKAEKATWIYIVGCDPCMVPSYPVRLGEPTHVIRTRRRDKTGVKWVSHAEREHTPPKMAEWMVELARRCSKISQYGPNTHFVKSTR